MECAVSPLFARGVRRAGIGVSHAERSCSMSGAEPSALAITLAITRK